VQCQFTQTAKTPILQLGADSGLNNLQTGSQAFQQILASTYDVSQIPDKYSQKLLIQLGQAPHVTPLPVCIVAEYEQGWHPAHEATASSPSSLHFRHHMAGIEDLLIAKINCLVANIRLVTGISLEH